jgi:hypothetical protein
MSEVKKMKVGDVVFSSWGCDQTNVDFYVVVKRTPKMVTIQAVPTKIEASGKNAMDGVAMPDLDAPRGGKLIRKKAHLDMHGTAEILQLHSWGCLVYQWDGKPQRTSWYA